VGAQRGKLARCGAERLFDALLVGGEEAAAGAGGKPDARIFHKAARLVGVRPCEARAPLGLGYHG
jgi:FMN phosphatase YigB (HAD superfamily)